ncbi:MAG TPA: cytochrome P460 family protein [Steroidobacteraceae bacterium]|nr:cytochrome P460 family protein [Steroidobacteraceae bacterium]
MKTSIARIISAAAGVVALGSGLYAAHARGQANPAAQGSRHVANLDAAGRLTRPADLDRWVFLGASLGMNYNDAAFSVEHPGAFQVVLMEPIAYQYFKEHGHYADGSMFLLSFYETQRGASIDRAGFVPGSLNAFEIHVVDHTRYAEGHAFFLFDKDAHDSTAQAPGNPCVKCHVPNGAYDGTFAQFYPPIRNLIPKPAK